MTDFQLFLTIWKQTEKNQITRIRDQTLQILDGYYQIPLQ